MEKTINVDFSDDEEEVVEEEIKELPEEEEMDDDFRAYIYNLTVKDYDEDDSFFTDKIHKKKKRERKKNQNKKKMVMLDFNQDLLANNKSTEKTWKSKRLASKITNKKEYKFKPKMVPFEYRFKNKNSSSSFTSLDNETDFPSL